MYTENFRNTHSDTQVVIFEIQKMANSYILGWEDLDLYGANERKKQTSCSWIAAKVWNPL